MRSAPSVTAERWSTPAAGKLPRWEPQPAQLRIIVDSA
jgi:hypothetical protein